jgi:metallo-beta-lactamase family protein
MQITFLGASMMVTGSSYLLETENLKILVDCGMFQGSKATEALNRQPFGFDPISLDLVLLTHAHIDHSGLLPKLHKAGFKGNIYTTKATTDLCQIMLADSAHIQEFESEMANRKGKRAGRLPMEPLYTVDDAYRCMSQFAPVPYNQKLAIRPNLFVKFNDAGHILGSSIIEIWIKEGDKQIKLVFSGDLGRPAQPLIKNPTFIEETDYVILESTYGNRNHEEFDKQTVLADIINDTVKRGGNVVIPAFAVGRTQTIIYVLHQLLKAGRISDLPVYIDSPLAISATDIFMHNPQDFAAEAAEMLNLLHDNPLLLPHLVFTKTAEESKHINETSGSAIIISASGMADAGRILHHLKHNLWRPESSVLLVGFQAQGSLGRRLLDGVKRVKIMGEEIGVKAKIFNLDGFSAHADQDHLIDWLEHFQPAPANVFIVHGEQVAQETLAGLIKDKTGIASYIPRYGDMAVLDGREFHLEPSKVILLDPHVQQMQELMDLLDSEYMELHKKLEQVALNNTTKIMGMVADMEKIRKIIRKTLEAMDDGK